MSPEAAAGPGRSHRAAGVVGWVAAAAVAAAGLTHLGLLYYIFLSRLTYPFDLEWMEGGMLCHALRLMEGKALYGPPSADFIAYLYTPLYPTVVALLGKVLGLSYGLARAVSLLSFTGVLLLVGRAVWREAQSRQGILWGIAAAGLVAASFQHTGAWYDLVRNDSLYLLLTVSGLYLLRYHHRRLGTLVAASLLLGAAFLAKQTASLFIVYSGLALLLLNWRRLPLHVALVGLVAGGTLLLWNHVSDGWFWRYTFEMHQGHDLYWDRIWPVTEKKLWEFFPAVGAVLGLWLVSLPLCWLLDRRGTRGRQAPSAGQAEQQGAAVAAAPAAAGAAGQGSAVPHAGPRRATLSLLYWFGLALVGVAVSAVGYATQWASSNAFIPGLIFPSVFAAMVGATLSRRWSAGWRRWVGASLGLLVAAGLCWQLWGSLYSPRPHIPTDRDRQAGERLVQLLRGIPGPVMMPYHPYYPVRAGKAPTYPQMGVNDVTRAGYPMPRDIPGRIRRGHYGAILLDNPPRGRYDFIFGRYKLARYFRWDEVPKVVTGYPVRPTYLFVPKGDDPVPAGGRRVFDFEGKDFAGWTVEGSAFGRGPVGGPIWDQGPVGPFEGRQLVSSYHGGDRARGRLLSPEFTVDRPWLSYRIGGGRHGGQLELRLLAGDQVIHRGTGPNSDVMELRRVDLSRHQGATLRLELVDQATGGWGHILFDDVVLLAR